MTSTPDSTAEAAATPVGFVIQLAFSLGCEMVELYREGLPLQSKPPEPEPRLPGVGSLSPSQRGLLRLDRIDSALSHLSSQIAASGLERPDTKALRELQPSSTKEQREGVIYTQHLELLRVLTATDYRLGRAYGLGRALADCRGSHEDLDELESRFGRYRLDHLRGWLNDSASNLPDHSAKAVLAGLTRWEAWVANVRRVLGTAHPEVAAETAWTHYSKAVGAILGRQIEMWRAVLSGEKDARDMLTADSYLKAAIAQLRNVVALARRVPLGYVLGVALLVGLIIAFVVFVLSNGT